MSATSRPTSVLLDKSVVREALRAIDRLAAGRSLPERQSLTFSAIAVLLEQRIPTSITQQLLQILRLPHAFHLAEQLLPHLRVLAPGRYLKRWARRLREEGFSREDAVILAHASFGIDEPGRALGTEAVLTTDYALKARYEQRFDRISERFERMRRQLGVPYRSATLRIVLAPEELLRVLTG